MSDIDIYTNKHTLPEPKPEMGQHIGQFLFDLRQETGYVTSGRVSCRDGTTAWMQANVLEKGPDVFADHVRRRRAA